MELQYGDGSALFGLAGGPADIDDRTRPTRHPIDPVQQPAGHGRVGVDAAVEGLAKSQDGDESALFAYPLIELAGGLADIHDRTQPTQHPIDSAQQLAGRGRNRDRGERDCTEGEKVPAHVEDGKAMALEYARAGVR